MKKQTLIGKRVKGFRFTEKGTLGEVGWNHRMADYVGRIGTIAEYNTEEGEPRCRVEFDDDYWWYPADQIEAHLVVELPERWCVRPPKSNPECSSTLKWFNAQGGYQYEGGHEEDFYWHFPAYEICDGVKQFCYCSPKPGYTEITWQQFETEILNKQPMQTTTIKKSKLKRIYDVACANWQDRITEYARRNPWGDTVEFTPQEIDAMFKAATTEQRPVLESVFGKRTKDVDTSKLNLKDGHSGRGFYDDEPILTHRMVGDYACKSFWLAPGFEWKIVKDETGSMVLIPTRR